MLSVLKNIQRLLGVIKRTADAEQVRERAAETALGTYLTSWPEGDINSVLKKLITEEEDENEDPVCVVWEGYEDWDLEDLANQIRDHYESLIEMVEGKSNG